MDIILDRSDGQYIPDQLTGSTRFIMGVGDRLRIQYKPHGGDVDDLLDEQVPSGKSWAVRIHIGIVESDA